MTTNYDNFAKDFSASRQGGWPEFDLVLQYLKKGGRVLDLGCGNGRLRKALGKDLVPQGHYFGLDLSEELLKIAREEFEGDHFFRGDFAEVLPFGDDNFDMVVCIAAFHHLTSKRDQVRFLKECFRVLKPDGIIFVTTWKIPKKHFWPNVLRGRFKNWIVPFGREKAPRVYRRVSGGELQGLLKRAGFGVLQVELFRGRNFVGVGGKSEK